MIGGEDFDTSIGQGEQAQGKDMEAYQRRREFRGVGGREKK